MQVCHRGRNKQRDCDRKSEGVMEREWKQTGGASGKNNKYTMLVEASTSVAANEHIALEKSLQKKITGLEHAQH